MCVQMCLHTKEMDGCHCILRMQRDISDPTLWYGPELPHTESHGVQLYMDCRLPANEEYIFFK